MTRSGSERGDKAVEGVIADGGHIPLVSNVFGKPCELEDIVGGVECGVWESGVFGLA